MNSKIDEPDTADIIVCRYRNSGIRPVLAQPQDQSLRAVQEKKGGNLSGSDCQYHLGGDPLCDLRYNPKLDLYYPEGHWKYDWDPSKCRA